MRNRVSNFIACATVFSAALVCFCTAANAQTYQLVPTTVYEKKPVTVTTWVDETVTEKQTVTSYKPIYQTEARERTRTTYKPVRRTSEREVKETVYKPFTETLYREKRTEETEYETVTRYRDEEYTVREPVIETSMREETVTVSKPVTQKLIEVKKTTTYKPVVKSDTQMVPAQLVIPGTAVDPNQRPRMQMLQPGYYTDPATGLTVYRRRGLHWVAPGTPATVAPTLVPIQRNAVEFEPETVEERKPVELTRFVEQVETRKVPVEVEKLVDRVKTRRVPYEVKIPKTKVTIEQIPYTQTTYKEEVVTKKVPYTETVYQRVDVTEPYEVETKRWIPVTKEIEVPKKVRRKVERTIMKQVPRTVLLKVPLDVFGNPIRGEGEIVSPAPATSKNAADQVPHIASSTTRTRKPELSSTPSADSYTGEVYLEGPEKTLDETSGKSILESNDGDAELQKIQREEVQLENSAPEVILTEPRQPEDIPAATGDEKAGERVQNSSDEDDRI